MSRRSPCDRLVGGGSCGVGERVRACTAPFATVVRAKIVLLAVDGEPNIRIAERLDVHCGTVSMWHKRLFESGLPGLEDRARSGRPRSSAAEVVAEVKAMACEPPAQREAPLSRWSSTELAAQAVAEPPGALTGAGVPTARGARAGAGAGRGLSRRRGRRAPPVDQWQERTRCSPVPVTRGLDADVRLQ